ncbi:SpoIID-LytB: SpoIID/LytB domain-containing protein [Gaiella occulta]|uniref:SpoIID-LytB: SpoIID/LytB domain-containing protein n=1 Tax=Gaiella occulta TaxID=1002870 RepID=A0A7M2YV82_9ACTN|nr:SpoIID/LytB domain-containing protein [Gaiella occulta]RDI73986.1 SpoIID-LytB: SpoIID/LytB domain-containing protein [Gaiella occulta]
MGHFVRHLILLLSVLALAAGASAATPPGDSAPAPAPALSSPVYVLTGGGYGHGVGLSQFGALAQANAGRSYRDILDFYYPGTTIATSPRSRVRVLLGAGLTTVTIGSSVPFAVRDATGARTPLPAGELTLAPDLALTIDGQPTVLPGPLAFLPGKGGPLTLGGNGYRGELRVSVVDGALQVIDAVGLDAYLFGVVPGEMPKEWPAAALQAQAVAARSYALANLVKNRPFDLYSDQRSQVYRGVAAESPSTTAAVKATRGEILTFDGKVATTLYSASSGGRTAASADVFGVPFAYLRTRDDPWDAESPYHRWPPRTYTSAALAKAFGLPSPVVDVEIVPTPSGRPASVTLVTRAGTRTLLKAADVRARLRLRSTAFRIGVLRITRPSGPVAPGAPVTVSGIARDVDGAVLEKLGATGAWLPTAKVAPAEDGAFQVTVRPTATATYRLTASGLPGPALTLTISDGAS